jgi:hypothetical protein
MDKFEQRVIEYDKIRLNTYHKIRQSILECSNEVYENSIKFLPENKQKELKELIPKLMDYVMQEFIKLDLCPSFICFGGHTFGSIYVKSELEARDLARCQKLNSKSI